MKALLFVLLSFFTVLSFAQNTLIWKGGTPGNENNWYTASNWDKNVVPDQDAHVIIKYLNTGHNAQPIIKDEVIVASIELQSRAILKIESKGKLTLDGTFTYSEGVLLFGGHILNEGALKFKNVDFTQQKAIAEIIMGNGKIYVDGKLNNQAYASQK